MNQDSARILRERTQRLMPNERPHSDFAHPPPAYTPTSHPPHLTAGHGAQGVASSNTTNPNPSGTTPNNPSSGTHNFTAEEALAEEQRRAHDTMAAKELQGTPSSSSGRSTSSDEEEGEDVAMPDIPSSPSNQQQRSQNRQNGIKVDARTTVSGTGNLVHADAIGAAGARAATLLMWTLRGNLAGLQLPQQQQQRQPEPTPAQKVEKAQMMREALQRNGFRDRGGGMPGRAAAVPQAGRGGAAAAGPAAAAAGAGIGPPRVSPPGGRDGGNGNNGNGNFNIPSSQGGGNQGPFRDGSTVHLHLDMGVRVTGNRNVVIKQSEKPQWLPYPPYGAAVQRGGTQQPSQPQGSPQSPPQYPQAAPQSPPQGQGQPQQQTTQMAAPVAPTTPPLRPTTVRQSAPGATVEDEIQQPTPDESVTSPKRKATGSAQRGRPSKKRAGGNNRRGRPRKDAGGDQGGESSAA